MPGREWLVSALHRAVRQAEYAGPADGVLRGWINGQCFRLITLPLTGTKTTPSAVRVREVIEGQTAISEQLGRGFRKIPIQELDDVLKVFAVCSLHYLLRKSRITHGVRVQCP